MLWVVQTNMFRDNCRAQVLDTLQRFGIPHQIVDGDRATMSASVDHDGPIITNGSIMLSQIAVERGWKPGSFWSDNFTYAVWHPILKDRCLNRDAILTTLGQIEPLSDKTFIRPISDEKTFTGCVVKREDFQSWRDRLYQRTISPTTPVVYGPAHSAIGQEHRHFIVDGEVVSSSRYKLSGVENESSDVDSAVVVFAAETARMWSPARAFVLDTYQTRGEIGVVELGGICHAGFYSADVQAIIMTLNETFW